ncbi:MAG: hypothetical protein CV045_10360 [Cyanobacteria bacterium M5B4]|nr:hypothetical protein [Cyanobacteria bacterium KgW148]PLS68003.1 MAG: hypothetical protein CV045_10360 [Cyanobacteria bacterium M5B4]
MSEAEPVGIVKVGEKEITLKPSANLPGKRPIAESGLEVSSMFRSGGADRPIGVSHFQIVEYLGGNRPVMSSDLQISEIYGGNRPVAPNTSDDSYVLMGYID